MNAGITRIWMQMSEKLIIQQAWGGLEIFLKQILQMILM